MSNVIKEFSRFAHQYDKHNEIQAQVAKTLVERILLEELPEKSSNNLLDLGCGSGAIAKNLQANKYIYNSLTAFDSSQEMLNIHPNSTNIIKICADFNNKDFIKLLPYQKYDFIISSSALQWSRDLNQIFLQLSNLSNYAYFAIFTSGTFRTLHHTAKIDSPIYSAKDIEESISKHYKNVEFELNRYSLHFNSVREMFQYIKKSGVSAGEKKLGFKETKRLMESYPLDYLEFEVLFVEAKNM